MLTRHLGRVAEDEIANDERSDPAILVDIIRCMKAEGIETSQRKILKRLQQRTGRQWSVEELTALYSQQVYDRNRKSLPLALRQRQAETQAQHVPQVATPARAWLDGGREEISESVAEPVAVQPLGSWTSGAASSRSARRHGEGTKYVNSTKHDDFIHIRKDGLEVGRIASDFPDRRGHSRELVAGDNVTAVEATWSDCAKKVEIPAGSKGEVVGTYVNGDALITFAGKGRLTIRKEHLRSFTHAWRESPPMHRMRNNGHRPLQNRSEDGWDQYQRDFKQNAHHPREYQFKEDEEEGLPKLRNNRHRLRHNQAEHLRKFKFEGIEQDGRWCNELFSDDDYEQYEERAPTPPPPPLPPPPPPPPPPPDSCTAQSQDEKETPLELCSAPIVSPGTWTQELKDILRIGIERGSTSPLSHRRPDSCTIQSLGGKGTPLELCRPPTVSPGSWSILPNGHSGSQASRGRAPENPKTFENNYTASVSPSQGHYANQSYDMQWWQSQTMQQQMQWMMQQQQQGFNIGSTTSPTSHGDGQMQEHMWPLGVFPPQQDDVLQTQGGHSATPWRPLQSAIQSMEKQGRPHTRDLKGPQQPFQPYQFPQAMPNNDSAMKAGMLMPRGQQHSELQQPQQQLYQQQQQAQWQQPQQAQWQQHPLMFMIPSVQSPSPNAAQQHMYNPLPLQQIASRRSEQWPVDLQPHAEPDPHPSLESRFALQRVDTPEPGDEWQCNLHSF